MPDSPRIAKYYKSIWIIAIKEEIAALYVNVKSVMYSGIKRKQNNTSKFVVPLHS